jgi:hypothetical protein
MALRLHLWQRLDTVQTHSNLAFVKPTMRKMLYRDHACFGDLKRGLQGTPLSGSPAGVINFIIRVFSLLTTGSKASDPRSSLSYLQPVTMSLITYKHVIWMEHRFTFSKEILESHI